MQCPLCSIRNDQGANFCLSCGFQFNPAGLRAALGYKNCPSCSGPIEKESKFCSRCGFNLLTGQAHGTRGAAASMLYRPQAAVPTASQTRSRPSTPKATEPVLNFEAIAKAAPTEQAAPQAPAGLLADKVPAASLRARVLPALSVSMIVLTLSALWWLRGPPITSLTQKNSLVAARPAPHANSREQLISTVQTALAATSAAANDGPGSELPPASIGNNSLAGSSLHAASSLAIASRKQASQALPASSASEQDPAQSRKEFVAVSPAEASDLSLERPAESSSNSASGIKSHAALATPGKKNSGRLGKDANVPLNKSAALTADERSPSFAANVRNSDHSSIMELLIERCQIEHQIGREACVWNLCNKNWGRDGCPNYRAADFN
ncbi:hypothetical protein BH11PSE11_BH11PSE11_03330 [soil metagenome]